MVLNRGIVKTRACVCKTLVGAKKDITQKGKNWYKKNRILCTSKCKDLLSAYYLSNYCAISKKVFQFINCSRVRKILSQAVFEGESSTPITKTIYT